jgi:hypothetical protein
MSKKAYLSVEESCQMLGIEQQQLMEYASSGKLQMYRDGNKDLFKSQDIEALATELGVSLADATDLTAADAIQTPKPKEDSVITAEGISIFDDEDLEIDEADPMAKTQIAPSLDDQIALEGVGSGSGLLDLTRESDDTSLGPVLDDMEGITGSGLGSGLVEAGLSSGLDGMTSSGGMVSSGRMGLDSTAGQIGGGVRVETETVFIEEDDSTDAISGMFGGLLVGAAVIMLIVLAATLAAQQQAEPRFLSALQGNMAILVVAVIAVTIIAGGVGYLVGKAFQQTADNGSGIEG